MILASCVWSIPSILHLLIAYAMAWHGMAATKLNLCTKYGFLPVGSNSIAMEVTRLVDQGFPNRHSSRPSGRTSKA